MQEFANSSEFIQLSALTSAAFGTSVTVDPIEATVFRLYEAVFDRAPDAAGFELFVGALGNGILTLEQITAEFVASDEFQDTYGALSNADFVELLYTNVLPGNEDAAGRAAFTAALDNGDLTRAEMVAEFVESVEFTNTQQDAAAAFIATVYEDRDDLIDGGTGDDIMLGGDGADIFVLSTGEDRILDFQVGLDELDLGVFAADFADTDALLAVATQVGLDVVFDFGDGNTTTLANVDLDALMGADLIA